MALSLGSLTSVVAFAAAGSSSGAHAPPAAYRAGACNIGPAEIRARRRFGHLGAAATMLLLAALLAADADPAWRLLLFFPAAAAAAGYLQAAFRFCAAFGLRGVFNFGHRVGATTAVEDLEARRRDRHRALLIAALSVLAGAAVALLAPLLP